MDASRADALALFRSVVAALEAPVPVAAKPIDLDDVEILARTLYGEARGEPTEGKVAVASVILNRVRDPRWPDSVVGVCMQPWQFSAWNQNDPNRSKLMSVGLSDKSFRDCLQVAMDVLSGAFKDPTLGSNHYLTSALAKSSPPKWYNAAKVTVTIGAHVFLKL